MKSLSASRQVAFHQLLVGARRKWLVDALREALGHVNPRMLKEQIAEYVPQDVQATLAAAGVRDEHVFPTPVVLEAQPTLVGYYRLLMGVSQKMFYRGDTGMGRFKSMEMSGTMSEAQKAALPDFCRVLGGSLADLVRQLSPSVTTRDVVELPLLTLGGQFQGAANVNVGKQATIDVFLGIADIVKKSGATQGEKMISLTNASGRRVIVALSADPDVRIEEDSGGTMRKKVAIEIKGGTDISNVHNRAGEAEKSHQKARADGFIDFWTIILTKGVDIPKLKSESPTTNAWFDAPQILGRQGPDWEEFVRRIAEATGIPH